MTGKPETKVPTSAAPRAAQAKPRNATVAERRASCRGAGALSNGHDRIDLTQVIAEFEAHRFGQEIEGCQYCDAEGAFFRDLVEGVVREQLRIDPLIDRHLAEGWRLNRVDFDPARNPARRRL